MDLITGHHVDKITVAGYDDGDKLELSYDFDEHNQRFILTIDIGDNESSVGITKQQARELRDFLNGLNLEGRG